MNSSAAVNVPWTEEQWSRVRQVVIEESRRSRVAASFLPLVGPLPKSVVVVPSLPMRDEPNPYAQQGIPDARLSQQELRLTVDDAETKQLTTIAVELFLKTSEVNDPDLAVALLQFRRAASIIARIEDALVFTGQTGKNGSPKQAQSIPKLYTIRGGGAYPGLVDSASHKEIEVEIPSQGHNKGSGADLVPAISQAVSNLENAGQLGPFACVLGDQLFVAANTPDQGSLVLPRDRFVPLLDGPLLRTGTLPPNKGIVVALAGAPVDLVVASEISVNFLQVDLEPRYVFRISERIAWRIKEPNAIQVLTSKDA